MKRSDDYKDDLAQVCSRMGPTPTGPYPYRTLPLTPTLAQVIDLEPDGARARIRIIPRLKIYTAKGDDDAQERKMRPPARLFKAEEIGKRGDIQPELPPLSLPLAQPLPLPLPLALPLASHPDPNPH